MSGSCLPCKWLFVRDTGYSSYTVLGHEAHCVVQLNQQLPEEMPDELTTWSHASGLALQMVGGHDRWACTRGKRCDAFVDRGSMKPYQIDVDGDAMPTKEEAMRALEHECDPLPELIRRYFEGE